MARNLVLYDLAGNGQPWSPNTIVRLLRVYDLTLQRTRLALAHKRMPFETVWIRLHEVAPTIKALGLPPGSGTPQHTVPTLGYDDESGTRRYIMGVVAIAEQLERWQPEPSLGDIGPDSGDGQRLRAALNSISPHISCA